MPKVSKQLCMKILPSKLKDHGVQFPFGYPPESYEENDML